VKERLNKVLIFAGFDHEPNQYQSEAAADHKDGEPNNRHPQQKNGADDQDSDHRTNCNAAIARPNQLIPLELLLARLRCPFFRLLAFCNVGRVPNNFPAGGVPQEARLVPHPKVMAVLGSKPVLLHQVALGHQDRRFFDSGLLVIGMPTVNPPVRGLRVLDFVTQDSLNAVISRIIEGIECQDEYPGIRPVNRVGGLEDRD
jgi:hypothetical protein